MTKQESKLRQLRSIWARDVRTSDELRLKTIDAYNTLQTYTERWRTAWEKELEAIQHSLISEANYLEYKAELAENPEPLPQPIHRKE